MPFPKQQLLQHRWKFFPALRSDACSASLWAECFIGGDENSAEELGLGVGAILTLLAMPGLLVSLLMFENTARSSASCGATVFSILSPRLFPMSISSLSCR